MADPKPIDKLSLVVASGTYEKVHYAFVMAAGAAAVGIPVTMFFTMGACRAILGGVGWHALESEVHGMSARHRDEDFAEKGVATLDELIESTAELGVKFLVCEMGLTAEGLSHEPMRDGLDVEVTGVVTFLSDASANGSIIYI